MYNQTKYNLEYYRKTQGKKRDHHKWQRWEIDLILDKKYCDRKLSDMLQRSMMAIAVKRSTVLKKMYNDIIEEHQNHNRWLARQTFPNEDDFKIPDDN